jgi:hypothetical protein
MSYKLVSGYQVNEDLRFLFGLETVLKTDQATEYHIGIDIFSDYRFQQNIN